jgi:tRNA pseudouridine55 synthase
MPDQCGFLLIDKPAGISSFDVIRRLRKVTGIRRIGHTGTLDPFATGLLICSLGSYTRLNQYLESQDKSYLAVLRLGEKTGSGDTEGEVVENGAVPAAVDFPSITSRVLALESLPTPVYSAVKVGGKPSYAYARQGNPLDLPPRSVKIMEFQPLSYEAPHLTYRCRVSKGTYIRSLSEYIAEQLGTVGHTVSLRRTNIGSVSVEEAVQLDLLSPDNYASFFFPESRLFEAYTGRVSSEDELSHLRAGRAIHEAGGGEGKVMLFGQDGRITGVAEWRDGWLYPVINLA